MPALQNKKFGFRRGAAQPSSAAYTPVREQRRQATTKYQDKIRSFGETVWQTPK